MDSVKDRARGVEGVSAQVAAAIADGAKHATGWLIERFASEEDKAVGKEYSREECLRLFGVPEQRTFINAEMVPGMGNILVNAGINAMWTLIAGTGGTKFDNSNAYLGVGDSSTAESAAQTDLQAATNKLRVAMESGYPTYGTSQQAVWKSSFGSAQANYAWEEFAVFNASSGGTMLNRKTSSQGTKTSGQTWDLTLTITLS